MVESNISEISREKPISPEKEKNLWLLAEGDVINLKIYHPREGENPKNFLVPWDVMIEIEQEKDEKKRIKNISKAERITFTDYERELLANKTKIGLGRVNKILKDKQEVTSLKLSLGDFDVISKGDKIKIFLPFHRNEWRRQKPSHKKVS